MTEDSTPSLTTEATNPASASIDRMTPLEIVHLMNQEDRIVADAVATQAEPIATAIEQIASRLAAGGRLLYIGAGTSGRLGVLDASECPPTFRSPPEQVLGIIAGGPAALTHAIEGAEDSGEQATADLRQHDVTAADAVVGIATSGTTPYVLAAMQDAREQGAVTIGLTCNQTAPLIQSVDIAIVPVVGPEVITGSTRLKAGTATKMVLNMLSTGAMVRLGKTYGHRMVDLRATNQKLTRRAERMVSELLDCPLSEARERLASCDGEVKTVLAAAWLNLTPDEARRQLATVQGHLHRLLPAAAPSPSSRA